MRKVQAIAFTAWVAPLVDHVATDDAEAVREAIALAAALAPLAPTAWRRRLRQRRRREFESLRSLSVP